MNNKKVALCHRYFGLMYAEMALERCQVSAVPPGGASPPSGGECGFVFPSCLCSSILFISSSRDDSDYFDNFALNEAKSVWPFRNGTQKARFLNLASVTSKRAIGSPIAHAFFLTIPDGCWGSRTLRHPKDPPYRCFLPDLADFTGHLLYGTQPTPNLQESWNKDQVEYPGK